MRVHNDGARSSGSRIGIILVFLGLLQACSAFPQMVRHNDPLTSDEHMRLGASYEAQGQTDNAVQQFQAALRLQKSNVPAQIELGNLAFQRGDLKEAESRYRRVLRLQPNHAGANNNLAMIYLSRGKDLNKAERFAQTALSQEGSLQPYILETLASIYIRQGRYAQARTALDKADAAASPDDKALHEQLIKTRQNLKPE